MAEPMIPVALARSSAFLKDLRALLSLRPDQIGELTRHFGGKASFDIDAAASAELARQLDVEPRELSGALSVVLFVYGRKFQLGLSEEELTSAIQGLAADAEIELEPEMASALVELLKPKQGVDFDLLRTTAEAVLPTVTSIEMACDMRVVCGSDKKVLGLIPVVMARFELDEPVAGQSAFVFQFTEALVDQLEDDVKSIRRVLVDAKKDLGDKVLKAESD